MASRRNTDEGEQQETTKRQKILDPDAIEQRLLVSNEESSIIIGRKGSNVERVRTESEALVTILKPTVAPNVNERVMVIKGNPTQIATAIHVIARILVENTRGTVNSVTGATDIIVVKFLFHKFLAGCIIGQAGSIMKEIQTSTNVRLSVSTEALGGSTEKACTITGTPDAVYAASMRIIDQLVTNPLRPGCSTSLYVPGQVAAAGEFFPLPGQVQESGGYYGGSAAPYSGDQYGQYGASPYQDYASSPAEGGMPLRISPLYQGGGAASYPQDPGYYPPSGSYGRGEYRGEQKTNRGGVQRIVPLVSLPVVGSASNAGNTEKIVIPKSASGAVIGRGGLIISSIKQQSGTQISIADAAANSEDRVVSITGPPQSIQNAIFLIRQRVDAQANMAASQFA
jgi:transcription antitermination factor NusA-like protein